MGKVIIFVMYLFATSTSFAWESSADKASKARWSQDQIEYYADSYARFLENLRHSSEARENQVKNCLYSVNFSYKSCLAAYSQGDGGVTYWADRCSEIHYPNVDKGKSSEVLGCCRMFSGSDLASCRKFVFEHLNYDVNSDRDVLLNIEQIRAAVEDTGICTKVGTSRDTSVYCQGSRSRAEVRANKPSEAISQTPRKEYRPAVVPPRPKERVETEKSINCDSPRTTEELNACQLKKMRNSNSR